MNHAAGSSVHVCVTIVFDWKTVAAIGGTILIRLLIK